MLRRSRWSVLAYSLALTAVSAFVVGAATWAIMPGISIALALAIGAAVAEPVGIPCRLVANLQTEGIFNDAVSWGLVQLS